MLLIKNPEPQWGTVVFINSHPKKQKPWQNTSRKDFTRDTFILQSPQWPAPSFYVDKKDGNLCPVQDYQALSNITIKNTAPLPLIPALIDKLCRVHYYSMCNVCWGYNNIHIKEGNEWKSAFKTPLGLFEPMVMTFGLCNAPATFQTFMNNIFEDIINIGHVIVYLVDILIFAEDLTMLNNLSSEVLACLKKYDLYLKPEKCSCVSWTHIFYLIFQYFIQIYLVKV